MKSLYIYFALGAKPQISMVLDAPKPQIPRQRALLILWGSFSFCSRYLRHFGTIILKYLFVSLGFESATMLQPYQIGGCLIIPLVSFPALPASFLKPWGISCNGLEFIFWNNLIIIYMVSGLQQLGLDLNLSFIFK